MHGMRPDFVCFISIKSSVLVRSPILVVITGTVGRWNSWLNRRIHIPPSRKAFDVKSVLLETEYNLREMGSILCHFSRKDKTKKEHYSLTECNLIFFEQDYEKYHNSQLACRINAWLKESKARSKRRCFRLRICCICRHPTNISDSDLPQQGLSHWLPRRGSDDRSESCSSDT